FAVGAIGVAAGCSSSDTATPGSPASGVPSNAPAVLDDTVTIDEVAFYQGVKAIVVKDGALVPVLKRNAPVIANRPAFVRVFVKANGRARPKVGGDLTLKRAGKADLVLHDGDKRILPELDDSALDNTLNFEVAAEDMSAEVA